jgi:hypothetical protein
MISVGIGSRFIVIVEAVVFIGAKHIGVIHFSIRFVVGSHLALDVDDDQVFDTIAYLFLSCAYCWRNKILARLSIQPRER